MRSCNLDLRHLPAPCSLATPRSGVRLPAVSKVFASCGRMSCNDRSEREGAMASHASYRVTAAQLSCGNGNANQNHDCLCERQKHFAAALLDPDAPVPPGLVGP